MEVLFERACIEDVPKIIEVQNICFKEDYILYGECPAYNETEAAIARQIADNIVYKILIEGEIIGDIILRRYEQDSYYLRVLSVLPQWQSTGIGSKAIAFIENDNPEANEWSLVTPFLNKRNNHFYKKMGYEKIDEVKHSDCLTLCKYRKVMR